MIPGRVSGRCHLKLWSLGEKQSARQREGCSERTANAKVLSGESSWLVRSSSQVRAAISKEDSGMRGGRGWKPGGRSLKGLPCSLL